MQFSELYVYINTYFPEEFIHICTNLISTRFLIIIGVCTKQADKFGCLISTTV